ncbi:mitochondrial ribosomal protein [Reticulomyxa filosa]|uniref:Mitochondrial ribosomal protein n=1 Tax=Reticulomyxa filosa TaxID=46433 RepID=X6LAG2_RETFI|nr:mitochondrial ribosomal protein [Reticulomyxa filosa]|eukprot:ETN98340.1 mitochondrial ribosomal protein [Reticulomyxa filosa]
MNIKFEYHFELNGLTYFEMNNKKTKNVCPTKLCKKRGWKKTSPHTNKPKQTWETYSLEERTNYSDVWFTLKPEKKEKILACIKRKDINEQEKVLLFDSLEIWPFGHDIKRVVFYLEHSCIIESLPPLPISLMISQAISIKDEILIFGGFGFNKSKCYSYNIIRKEYKFICDYPKEIQFLNGHNVLRINNFVFNDNNDNNILLLTFGGNNIELFKRFTYIMNYKSVWNENNINNEWINLINNLNNTNIIIGKEKYYDLVNSHSCIGGKDNNLLFIICSPNFIIIFNLITYEYISTKNYILPNINNNNNNNLNKFSPSFIKIDINQFILINYQQTILIIYDESINTFIYKLLSNTPITLKYYNCFSYILLRNHIICFGGKKGEYPYQTITDSIHTFNIITNIWKRIPIFLPFPLFNTFSVVSYDFQFIHIIGGQHDHYNQLDQHFIISANDLVWDPKHVDFIILRWLQETQLRYFIGWIDDFNRIILSMLC